MQIPIELANGSVEYVEIDEGLNFRDINNINNNRYYYPKKHYYIIELDSTSNIINITVYDVNALAAFYDDSYRYYNDREFLANYINSTNTQYLFDYTSIDSTNLDKFVITLKNKLNNVFLNDDIIIEYLEDTTTFIQYLDNFILREKNGKIVNFLDKALFTLYNLNIAINTYFNVIAFLNSNDEIDLIEKINLIYLYILGLEKIPKVSIKSNIGFLYNVFSNLLYASDPKNPESFKNIERQFDLSKIIDEKAVQSAQKIDI